MLVASLQLVVPGAAAWADAELDARGHAAQVHIESHATSSCARVHPPDCGLCRFLFSFLSTQTPRQAKLSFVFLSVSGRPDRAVPLRVRRRGQPPPRAPPALS